LAEDGKVMRRRYEDAGLGGNVDEGAGGFDAVRERLRGWRRLGPEEVRVGRKEVAVKSDENGEVGVAEDGGEQLLCSIGRGVLVF
jgi:hypothetical protein